MPFDTWPNSLAEDVLQASLYLSSWIRCLYSSISPLSSSNTAKVTKLNSDVYNAVWGSWAHIADSPICCGWLVVVYHVVVVVTWVLAVLLWEVPYVALPLPLDLCPAASPLPLKLASLEGACCNLVEFVYHDGKWLASHYQNNSLTVPIARLPSFLLVMLYLLFLWVLASHPGMLWWLHYKM